MIYLAAKQKVEDYDKWKLVFDEHSTQRRVQGSKGAKILRDANDPNKLVIITKWEDVETAKNFAKSKDLRVTMKNAGVIGLPELYFLEDVETEDY